MSQTLSEGVLRYEPFDPDDREHLYEVYGRLRDEAPVYRTASGYWAVSRYDDVREILRSPERFSSSPQQDEVFGLEVDPDTDPEAMAGLLALVGSLPIDVEQLLSARIILGADAPQHTRIRRVVSRGFTPRRISELDATIKGFVDDCLAGIETAGCFDIVTQLAEPLTMQAIGNILGMPPEDRRLVRDWTDRSTAATFGDWRGTLEARMAVLEVLKEFSQYFVGMIEARKTAPTDDLVSQLVRAEEAETLTTVEALMFLLALMQGGTESTMTLTGNMMLSLLQHPDQLRLLQERPELIPHAIEECGRYRSPVQFFYRKAIGDQEIAGTTIPDGDVLIVLIGSANTDPRRFPEPNRLDITRDTAGALTFGTGPHFCIGAALGRLELTNALAAMLPHLSRLQLSVEPLRLKPNCLTYGYEHVLLEAR